QTPVVQPSPPVVDDGQAVRPFPHGLGVPVQHGTRRPPPGGPVPLGEHLPRAPRQVTTRRATNSRGRVLPCLADPREVVARRGRGRCALTCRHPPPPVLGSPASSPGQSGKVKRVTSLFRRMTLVTGAVRDTMSPGQHGTRRGSRGCQPY